MAANVLGLISQTDVLVDLDLNWKGVIKVNENVEELIRKTRLCVKKIIALKSKEIVLVQAYKKIADLSKDTMYVEEMNELVHFFTDPSGEFTEYSVFIGQVNGLCVDLIVPMEKQMNTDLELAKDANLRIGKLQANVTDMHKCMEKQTSYATELDIKVRHVLHDAQRMASFIPVDERDSDMYQDLRKLRTSQIACVESLVASVKDETSKLLVQREMLRCLSSSSELPVPSLSQAFRGIGTYIRKSHDEAREIYNEGQKTVQRYADQTRQHRDTIDTHECTIRNNSERVNLLDVEINKLNDMIPELESAAKQLEDRADELKQQRSSVNPLRWLGSVAAMTVGLMLAPFTGGLSLALTAVGIYVDDIDWNNYASCKENASETRRQIRYKNNERNAHRKEKEKLRKNNETERENIANIQRQIQSINTATEVLDKGSRSTDGMTSAMTPVISTFEQMDTEAEKALLETKKYVEEKIKQKQKESFRSSTRDTIETVEFTTEEELQILQKKISYVDDNIQRMLRTSAMLTELLESAEDVLDSTETCVKDRIYVAIDTSVKSSPYDKELEILRQKGERFERRFEQLKPYLDKLRTMIRVFASSMDCAEEITSISNELRVMADELLKAMEQRTKVLAQRKVPPVGNALVLTDINSKTDTRLMPAQELFNFKAKWERLCDLLLDL